jgi:NAD(P)-dependent dehydrogenase (short-subunit alcohol dehydrogenase family)
MATILITGAGRGIGLELARQYAADGNDVIACVRDPGAATELAELGDRVRVQQLDPGDPASIDAAAAAIGSKPIDVVINNAGAMGGTHQSLDDLDLDALVATFKVNAIGPLLVARALKANLAAAEGKLMTVTSQLGASTWPMGGMYGYSTSKAAVNKAMQALAIDWKDEPIVVSLVHPGWVRTDMGGPHADITPEESASGIRQVIAGLGKADSGRFYKWNGEIHPW